MNETVVAEIGNHVKNAAIGEDIIMNITESNEAIKSLQTNLNMVTYAVCFIAGIVLLNTALLLSLIQN